MVFANESLKVVEDNIVNQKVTVKMLEKLGYRCDVAGNVRIFLEVSQVNSGVQGLEAVEAARAINYDIILMDCQVYLTNICFWTFG